ncbi:MAG: hypothetical protein WDW36_007202 [Sanguina aurantia]
MSNLRILASSLPGVQQLLGLALSQHQAIQLVRTYSTPSDGTPPAVKPAENTATAPAASQGSSEPVSAAPAAGEESGLSTSNSDALEKGSKDDEWAAVVEEKSGQIYYWNLRTASSLASDATLLSLAHRADH